MSSQEPRSDVLPAENSTFQIGPCAAEIPPSSSPPLPPLDVPIRDASSADIPHSDNPASDISRSGNPAPDIPQSDNPDPDVPNSDNLAPDNPAPDTPQSDIPAPDLPLSDNPAPAGQGSGGTLSPTISGVQVPDSDSLDNLEQSPAAAAIQSSERRATKTPTPALESADSSDSPDLSDSPDPLSTKQNSVGAPRSYTLRDLQQKIQYQPPTPRPSQKAAKAHVGTPHSPPAIHTQLAKRKLKDSMRPGPDVPLKTVEARSPSPSKIRSRPNSAGRYPTPLKGMSENIPSPRKRARKSKVSTPPLGLRHELEMVRMPGPEAEQDELAGNTLLLDEASRKISLIAFGAQGPLNQGRWSKSPKGGDQREDDIENASVENC